MDEHRLNKAAQHEVMKDVVRILHAKAFHPIDRLEILTTIIGGVTACAEKAFKDSLLLDAALKDITEMHKHCLEALNDKSPI